MKYLVISDVHGNLEALRAVLAHCARKRRDAVLFLGDAVGYGASPNQVLERLRALGKTLVAVRGNHDRVVLDPRQGAAFFNTHARQAAGWSATVLTVPNRRFLKSFTVGPLFVEDGIALCHGSPTDEDDYVFTEAEAKEGFEAIAARVIFYGHSHVPCLFELSPRGGPDEIVGVMLRGSRVSIDLDPTRRYLINPGSVGQPRDRDPRASYGIFDAALNRFTLYRVPYDSNGAQRRIRAAGLPAALAERLGRGA
ncbi:MAG: metallophosphoesterase family protein [Acidobacteriota bacterium]